MFFIDFLSVNLVFHDSENFSVQRTVPFHYVYGPD